MGKTTKILPLAAIFFIWFIFSYQFFLKGLIPAPLDFLTNFYNPWQAYQAFPIKNPEIPDVVSQIIPWKIYTIESFKSGIMPLWNPYNFSGTPHLANFQSAVFSIFNFLFFIFSFKTAWSLFILFQPLLAGIFTYIYCRKINFSQKASLISAISFSFGGFLAVWLEYGTLVWAILWLPLTLYLWEYFFEKKKAAFLILISIAITFSLFSGHLQISLYLIFVNVLYLLFSYWQKKINLKFLLIGFLALFFSLLLAAVQLLPTLEFYLNSPRSQQIPTAWYKGLQIPWYYLVTLIFPDFYGHPATRNGWTEGSYVEMMAYGGLLPILMAVFYLMMKIKNRKINKNDKSLFFIGLFLLSLLLALPTPLSDLILWLRIPVLSSSAPSRIICLTGFSLAILAGFGWEIFYRNIINKNRLIIKFLSIFLILFLILLPISYLTIKIAFRNIIFPFLIYIIFITATLLVFLKNKKLFFNFYFLLFIFLLMVDLFRFWHKFNPFSSQESFYSTLSLMGFLQQNGHYNRVYGVLDDNLNLPFGIFSTTGYDSLTLTDYQRLTRSAKNGPAPLPERTTGENIAKRGKYSKKLLDMLGVKYVIVGKSDLFAFPTWEYPESFQNVWEDKNYKIFENKNVLPRFFLTSQYKIVSTDNFLTATLENKNYKELILTQDPRLQAGKIENELVTLERYQQDKIEFQTSTRNESLLFLSDVFYPGWEAKVDAIKVPIIKTNYIFRSVKVPIGNHKIEFVYEPRIFKTGILITSLTIITMTLFLFFGKLFIRL